MIIWWSHRSVCGCNATCVVGNYTAITIFFVYYYSNQCSKFSVY